MIVGIDASNLRAGSALTYMPNVLGAADPREHGIERVVVWGGRGLLDALPERKWIERAHDPVFERSALHRILWQRTKLPRLARERCNVLWVPGGTAAAGFRPMVTMCHNMLPFEFREALRYGASYMTLRLALLRLGHMRTFRRADGLILLTRHARDVVLRAVRPKGKTVTIPNGIEDRFKMAPRPQRPIAACSAEDPFRLLYVSIVDVYKHQDAVAQAVASVRASGIPVAIDFVGPAYAPALRKLERTIDRLDPSRLFLRYVGPVPFHELHTLHARSDAFVFASSCENMPLILMEAMAAALPIACSNRGPMPELLGDAGIFFDPDDPPSIAAALRTLVQDPELRARKAAAAHQASLAFSWERCSRETFAFIASFGG